MAGLALLCTDGSDVSLKALAAGLEVIDPALDPVLVTVLDEADITLVTGTGFAGGILSPEEFDRQQAQLEQAGAETLADAALSLGIGAAEHHSLRGPQGQAICDYAEERSAKVILIGSRGRGGVKRAVLGSVSDHVVRNAPCPVVVVGPEA